LDSGASIGGISSDLVSRSGFIYRCAVISKWSRPIPKPLAGRSIRLGGAPHCPNAAQSACVQRFDPGDRRRIARNIDMLVDRMSEAGL
jgi:hypothetical protein